MNTLDAMKNRHSVRAYLDQAVTDEQIRTILDAARFAPSGVNTQPWQVAVVEGEVKNQLAEQLVQAKMDQLPVTPDYKYYPDEWNEPYRSRRKDCGLAMYKAMDIKREDRERQIEAWNNNYYFFHAPVGLIFYIDKQLNKGSWLDLGMFMQNIMLAATDLGLATCPQASIADYADTIRSTLGIDDQFAIVAGMALGYEDTQQAVNTFRQQRESVEDFTHWYK